MQLRTNKLMVALTLVGASLWCVAGVMAASAPQEGKQDPTRQTVRLVGKVLLGDGSPATVRAIAIYDTGGRRGTMEFIGNARVTDDGEFFFETERAGTLMIVAHTTRGQAAARVTVRHGETKDVKLVVPRT